MVEQSGMSSRTNQQFVENEQMKFWWCQVVIGCENVSTNLNMFGMLMLNRIMGEPNYGWF